MLYLGHGNNAITQQKAVNIMTASKKASKTVTIVKAPKITTAWNNVCEVSNKSEAQIVESIVNLHNVLTTESRLSVADKKKYIKGLEDAGKVSSFIKASHVPAIPTWINFRKVHKGFTALPVAKQLSTAMASYDILGVGKGEQQKSLETLVKEIATVRKAKQSPKPAKSGTPKKDKDTLADILAYFTGLDMNTLTEEQKDTVAEIHAVLDNAMASA
jgi:hypothetical protein